MGLFIEYCPILGGEVIVIFDLEGNLKNVGRNQASGGRCPEFNRENCLCTKKIKNNVTLEGIDGRTIDPQSDPKRQYCEFFDPEIMWC